MSNSNCGSITAPINLTNDSKICEGSCKFQALYENEKMLAQNNNTYISVNYQTAANVPKAKFNDEEYKVKEIRIFKQSVHKYFNQYAPGEILIIHQNTSKPNQLFILSISINISNLSTPGTTQLTALINATSDQAPRSSLSANNSSGSEEVSPPFDPQIYFDLMKFIIPGGYYYYQGTFSFQNSLGSCNTPSHIIVYSPDQGSVNITQANWTILNALIDNPISANYPLFESAQLYMNDKGASGQEEDIYIDCQPVDKSTDTVYVPQKGYLSNFDQVGEELKKISTGPIAGGILGILLILGLFFCIKGLLSLFNNIGFKGKFFPDGIEMGTVQENAPYKTLAQRNT
jgi:hypothetical protein